jgi:hypothetical protein
MGSEGSTKERGLGQFVRLVVAVQEILLIPWLQSIGLERIWDILNTSNEYQLNDSYPCKENINQLSTLPIC